MIDGVIIKPLTVHKDIPDTKDHPGEGVLMEIARAGDELLPKFGQSVFTVFSGKGSIKAFHWHKIQYDLWFIATGKARIVLYDNRAESATHGQTEVIYAGAGDYKVIKIPPGVFHGYQVLSDEPVMLFYHVTELYDPNNLDEYRVPYDDPNIGFDWTVS